MNESSLNAIRPKHTLQDSLILQLSYYFIPNQKPVIYVTDVQEHGRCNWLVCTERDVSSTESIRLKRHRPPLRIAIEHDTGDMVSFQAGLAPNALQNGLLHVGSVHGRHVFGRCRFLGSAGSPCANYAAPAVATGSAILVTWLPARMIFWP